MKETRYWIPSSAEPECVLWKIQCVPGTNRGMKHENTNTFLKNSNMPKHKTVARGELT